MSMKQLEILLADDDEDDCMFFKQAIGQLPQSSHLTTVEDGEQLMQLLTQQTPQIPYILFLDVNMPRKNGNECLLEMKLNEKLKQIPVIMMSTSCEQDVINKLYNNGATYYICKPIEASQLKKVIQEALTLLSRENGLQPAKENFVLKGDLIQMP